MASVEARTGFARHRLATETLIKEHNPAWVISVGYSSSLSPNLKSGDLVLATEICDTHGNTLPIKCPIPASRRVHQGRFVVADDHPMTAEAKQKLAESSGAICTDTVSLAAAQICLDRGTRFLAIRAILDEANESIPQQAAGLLFDANSRAIGTALATLTRGLKQAGVLFDWRKRATAAADHLDRYVAGVILRIGERPESLAFCVMSVAFCRFSLREKNANRRSAKRTLLPRSERRLSNRRLAPSAHGT